MRNQFKSEVVRVATACNVKLFGLQNIDGIDVPAGHKVLVKDQDNPAENGIYVVWAGGWQRSITELIPSLVVFVLEGITNGCNIFYIGNTGRVTIGESSIEIKPFDNSIIGNIV